VNPSTPKLPVQNIYLYSQTEGVPSGKSGSDRWERPLILRSYPLIGNSSSNDSAWLI
jgi:hypothetical protein